MKYLIAALLIFLTVGLFGQLHTDQGKLNSGTLFVKLDRYGGNGEAEGYRGMIDMGNVEGSWSSILDRNGGMVSRFMTPFKLIKFMDFLDFEYIGTETYVLKNPNALRRKNKYEWTTIWIFNKTRGHEK